MNLRTGFLCLFMLAGLLAGEQRFNGGILLGGNVSQVDGDTWSGYYKVGFQAGGLVSLRISPRSSFQMEMEYFQKGSRKNADTEKEDYTSYLLRLHYLEIPVLYQYTFARRFFAEIGPAVDVLLGSTERVNDFDVPDPVPLRTLNVSGVIGFGGCITRHLKADIRFSYSLYSIRNGTANGYRKMLFEYGQYNNVLALTFYWEFKPNKNLDR